MADHVLAKPDPLALDNFLRAQAQRLRANDAAPADRKAWEQRRTALRQSMFAAMGRFPEKPAPLEARQVGLLQRQGYRIETLVFQSRTDVWVTANAYVPESST